MTTNLSYKEIYQSPNRAIVERIQKRILERNEYNVHTDFMWIPSHTTETNTKITEAKKKQIEILKSTFKEYFEEIIHANEKVDILAKEATSKSYPLTFPGLDEETNEVTLPLGCPAVNILNQNMEPLEGNLRKLVKEKQLDAHKNEIENEKGKKKNDYDTYETRITGEILKNTQSDSMIKIIMQTSHQDMATPKNCYRPDHAKADLTVGKIFTKQEVENLTTQQLKEKCVKNNQYKKGARATLINRLTSGEQKTRRKAKKQSWQVIAHDIISTPRLCATRRPAK